MLSYGTRVQIEDENGSLLEGMILSAVEYMDEELDDYSFDYEIELDSGETVWRLESEVSTLII